MATPEERLDEAATMAEAATAIATDWANGPVRDVIPEPLSGPLPTIKKFLASKSVEIDNAANAAAVLRDDIANGSADVGGVPSSRLAKTVIQVSHLKALPTTELVDGQQYSVAGFYAGSNLGGGTFVYDASRSWADHNGGTVIAPPAIAAWDGTQADIASMLNWTGSGVGCLVRLFSEPLCPSDFGAKPGFDSNATLNKIGQTGLHFEQKIPELSFSGSVLITNGTFFDISGNKIKAIRDNSYPPDLSLTPSIVINGNAKIKNGIIYTSGMTSPVVFTGTILVHQIYGDLDNVTLYAATDEVVRHERGKLNIKFYGGYSRGVRSILSLDEEVTHRVEYFNANIPYNDMVIVPLAPPPSDSRAVHVYPTIDITKKVEVHVNGDLCYKNGFWAGRSNNSSKMLNFFSYGSITRSGFWMDSTGAIIDGSGAGTCWEYEYCPYGVFMGDSAKPNGYNVAVFTGSHNSYVGGVHYGTQTKAAPFGGDPVIVVALSDDVTVDCSTVDGTVSVSVGEDNFKADRTKITGTFINAGWAPVLIGAASETQLVGATIVGEPRLTAWSGTTAGYGHPLPVVRVEVTDQFGSHLVNQDVTVSGCNINGWFTHTVLDKGGYNRLRVRESNNNINAPIISRENQNKKIISQFTAGSGFIRLLNDSETTGHANVGTFSLTSGQGFAIKALNPEFTNLDNLRDIADEVDYKNATNKIACLIYLKFRSEMLTDISYLRFGVSAAANSFNSPANYFFQTLKDAADYSILNRNWQDGEWIPIVIPLTLMVHSSVVGGVIANFVCRHNLGAGLTYDIEMTNPVLVYVGCNPRNYLP